MEDSEAEKTRVDRWTQDGEVEPARDVGLWTGYTFFNTIDADESTIGFEPADQVAQYKSIREPYQPTDTERALHNITHLRYRSRCQVCVQAKGKIDHHRHLQNRSPVIEIDFACWLDEQGNGPTILTAIDIQSGLAHAAVVDSKETSA